MVKYAAFISLGLGVLAMELVHIPLWHEPPAYSRFALSPAELARQSKYLDGVIQARNRYMAVEDQILHELGRGQLPLTQACDRLYHHAREVYPKYLNYLRNPKMCLKEKMARNCIEILRLETEDTPSYAEAVSRLEGELAGNTFREWCKEPWPEDSRR